jgi:hypothetical protein
MKDNKKIGLYIGVAVLVGSLGFLAYNKLTNKSKVVYKEDSTSDNSSTKTPKKGLFSSSLPVFSDKLELKY